MNASDVAKANARFLSAFRLSVGIVQSDAERLVSIAYEISKHAEVAGLTELSREASAIALRAFDASGLLS